MFVSFEGLDGSGKSTQVERLREALAASGREVVALREPGGTALGERLRELVLHGDEMTPWAEALLYAAARAELVAEVIGPRSSAAPTCSSTATSTARSPTRESAAGSVSTRCSSSTCSRSAASCPTGRSCSRSTPARSLARVGARPDRIERADAVFHERVSVAYEELAARFPERIVVLDGSLDPDELAERIQGELPRAR